MIIDRYNSTKITVLSTIAAIMVVYIHSYLPSAAELPISGRIQTFMSNFFMLANPFFFVVSGYLLFNSVSSIKDLIRKLKKRGKTIVLPYILWNIITLGIFATIKICSLYMPFSLNTDVILDISNADIWGSMKYIFVKPVAFQLWFLRDLIFFIALSPFIFIIIKHLGFTLAIALFCLDPFIHQGNLFFFVLGASLSKNLNLGIISLIPQFNKICIILCYTTLVILKTFDIWWNSVIIVPYDLFGVLTLWYSYDLIIRAKDINNTFFVTSICGYSFFIYCFHEPFLNIFKRINGHLLGDSDLSCAIIYLVNPVIMVMICIFIAGILKKNFNVIYRLLTGNR